MQEAETVLATANSERSTLELELRDGQERLRALREERVQQLRGELGAGVLSTSGVGHNVAQDADEQGLSDLQSRFDAFRSASEAMHAQLQAELQSLQGAQLQDLKRHERLVKLGPTEVATRLTQCHADHTAALGARNWEAAASLAQSLSYLSAAMRDANAAFKNAAAAVQIPETSVAKTADSVGANATHRDKPY